MLILEDIHYHHATAEKVVLKGINLKLSSLRPVIISGESGSGKTTLLEIISGLTRPNKGKIYWNKKYLNQRARRNLCGVVFQFPERHFLGLTVSQELRLGHRRISSEDQVKALTKVGLNELNFKEAPEKLSGGQQRRLALATQLLKKPSILILDEPTAGLDWSVRGEIVNLLEKLSKDQLLVIMSHEPELFSHWSVSSYQLFKGELLDYLYR